MNLFNERVLPTLDQNIKCGNSLVSTDFFEMESDPEVWKKVKPFNWQIEFKEVFKQGGFDAVIGNPPYGAIFNLQQKKYLSDTYHNQSYQRDSYLLFIEKTILDVVSEVGLLGYIVPNTWYVNVTQAKFQKFLFETVSIEKLAHFYYKVFKKAVVDTDIVIFYRKFDINNKIKVIKVKSPPDLYLQSCAKEYQQNKVDRLSIASDILNDAGVVSLIKKLGNHMALSELCKITQGAKPFQVGKGVPKQTKKTLLEKPFVSDKKVTKDFVPLLRGSLINRYQILWNKDYYIKFGEWLAEPRISADYDLPEKIIIRQTGDSLVATLDRRQFIVRDNLYTISINKNISNLNLSYILGLLNSKLLTFYYQKAINPEKGEAMAQVKKTHLQQLPIVTLNLGQEYKKSAYSRVIEYVNKLLELNKSAEPDQRQIQHYENQIDKLVYELYGLTEDEIKIIEEATSGSKS